MPWPPLHHSMLLHGPSPHLLFFLFFLLLLLLFFFLLLMLILFFTFFSNFQASLVSEEGSWVWR